MMGGFGKTLRYGLTAGIVLLLAVMLRTVSSAADGQFVARTWTTADGLPSNTINALAQSADGYLWVATPRGLCRYDGFRFVVCGENEGISSTGIQKMVADAGGQIWVQDEEWRVRARKGKLFQSVTADIAVDQGTADGSIWGMDRRSCTRYADGRSTTIPFPPGWTRGDAVKLLATRGQGLLMMSWRGEIQNYQNGMWRLWEGSHEIGDPEGAGALMEDASGAVWVTVRPDRVCKVAGGEGRVYSLPGLKDGFWEMAERVPGEVWATATDGKLWYLSGDVFREFPLPPGTVATRLQVDRSAALWVGTLGSGLLRIGGATVFSGKLDAVPGGGRITAMAELEPGTLALGAFRSGAWLWRDGRSSPLLAEDRGFLRDYIYCNALLKSRDGTLWAGTNFALHQIRDGRRVESGWLDKLIDAGDSVMSLHECRDGSVLAGTAAGRLFRIREGKVETIAIAHCQSTITTLAEAPDGAIWLGTGWDGIFRIHGLQETQFGEPRKAGGRRVFSVFFDRQGRLWAGMGTAGLFSLHQGGFVKVPLKGTGGTNSVLQLMEDDENWLWIGGDQGISGVSLAEAAAALNGGPEVMTVHAGQAEGMANGQCGAMSPLKTSDGRIVFGTAGGFASFRPRDLKEYSPSPSPVMEEIFINGTPMVLSPETTVVSIPPDARFEIHFTGIDLRDGDSLRFRCRLNGFETPWNEVGTRRFAAYTKVPPGEYQFEVETRNSSQWGPGSARLRLSVQPYYWQQWWFQALAALMVTGGVVFSVRARERRSARRRAAALQRVNEERTRIARDLHDGIGSGLSQVGMMAAVLHRELASSGCSGQSSKLLQQRIRSLAQDLDIAVWATSPRHDNVSALCTYLSEYMIEYFRDAGIRCWISIPEDLTETPISPEVRHHLFMCAREAMNNCLKHSQATEIRLEIRQSGSDLTLILADNGVGFSTGEAEKSHRNGLRNLRQRMASAGGTVFIESGPEGTTVTFSLHLPDAGSRKPPP